MAISLAYEAPGFFRDSSVPEKWGFLRRNKEAKDEPERFVYINCCLVLKTPKTADKD